MNANTVQTIYILAIILVAFLLAVSLIYLVQRGELKRFFAAHYLKDATGHGIKY